MENINNKEQTQGRDNFVDALTGVLQKAKIEKADYSPPAADKTQIIEKTRCDRLGQDEKTKARYLKLLAKEAKKRKAAQQKIKSYAQSLKQLNVDAKQKDQAYRKNLAELQNKVQQNTTDFARAVVSMEKEFAIRSKKNAISVARSKTDQARKQYSQTLAKLKCGKVQIAKLKSEKKKIVNAYKWQVAKSSVYAKKMADAYDWSVNNINQEAEERLAKKTSQCTKVIIELENYWRDQFKAVTKAMAKSKMQQIEQAKNEFEKKIGYYPKVIAGLKLLAKQNARDYQLKIAELLAQKDKEKNQYLEMIQKLKNMSILKQDEYIKKLAQLQDRSIEKIKAEKIATELLKSQAKANIKKMQAKVNFLQARNKEMAKTYDQKIKRIISLSQQKKTLYDQAVVEIKEEVKKKLQVSSISLNRSKARYIELQKRFNQWYQVSENDEVIYNTN